MWPLCSEQPTHSGMLAKGCIQCAAAHMLTAKGARPLPVTACAQDLQELRYQRGWEVIHLREPWQNADEQLPLPLLAGAPELPHKPEQLQIGTRLH